MGQVKRKITIRSESMDNLDVSGILMTYSEKARRARSKEHLKEIIRDLKAELDLRKIENYMCNSK